MLLYISILEIIYKKTNNVLPFPPFFLSFSKTKKTGKKYAVTGCSGMLGACMVEALLKRGEEVLGLDVRDSKIFSSFPNFRFESVGKFFQTGRMFSFFFYISHPSNTHM